MALVTCYWEVLWLLIPAHSEHEGLALQCIVGLRRSDQPKYNSPDAVAVVGHMQEVHILIPAFCQKTV